MSPRAHECYRKRSSYRIRHMLGAHASGLADGTSYKTMLGGAMMASVQCSYHEDRVAILCFGSERRQTLRQLLFPQVMFSSKSRMLRKLPCGAGVRDTRQLLYTSFLRFDTF